MKDYEIRGHFSKVLSKLDVIDAKVSGLPQVQVRIQRSSLLRVLVALKALARPVTASEVSAYAGMSRESACNNLNDLVGRGMAESERRRAPGSPGGPCRYFWLKEGVEFEG